MDSNHRSLRRRIYSPFPLTTRAPTHIICQPCCTSPHNPLTDIYFIRFADTSQGFFEKNYKTFSICRLKKYLPNQAASSHRSSTPIAAQATSLLLCNSSGTLVIKHFFAACPMHFVTAESIAPPSKIPTPGSILP